MPYQTGSKVLVALKRESTFGTAPVTVTGAVRLRIVDSPGLVLNRATIDSNEKTAEAIKPMGRLGAKSVEGSYSVEMSAGGAFDLLLEGLLRTSWATSTTIAAASVTNFLVATTNIQHGGGSSWLTAGGGIRVGDVFHLANYNESTVNGLLRVATAVTSNTLTFLPAFTTGGSADTAATLTRLGKLTSPNSAASLTRTQNQFAIEQYDNDIDLSELFLGCRVIGVRLSFRPGEMATAEFTFLGVDRTALAVGTSPFYDTPSLTTTLGLVADDSSIVFNGATVASFTGFDIEFSLAAAGEAVIGSLVMPDIFDNDLSVTGTITGLRQDFSNLTLYDAETEFEVAILLKEPTGSPPDGIGITLPRVKISGLSAPVGGGDGAKIETLNIMAAKYNSTGSDGYDSTIVNIASTQAS